MLTDDDYESNTECIAINDPRILIECNEFDNDVEGLDDIDYLLEDDTSYLRTILD